MSADENAIRHTVTSMIPKQLLDAPIITRSELTKTTSDFFEKTTSYNVMQNF